MVTHDEALARLSGMVPLVLQKRGASGLVLKRRGTEPLAQPTVATEIVDTTGAGDSVVGALAAGLSSGRTDRQILDLCSAVAARVIAGVGISGLVEP